MMSQTPKYKSTVHPENQKLAENSLNHVLNNPPGFVSLIERKNLLTEIDRVYSERGQQFGQFIICGIGGSSLGIRVIRDMFQSEKLLVLENVDHYDLDQTKKWIKDPSKTLFVFISKSGSTLETLVSLELFEQWGKDKKIQLADQSVVITETKESSLFNWAKNNNVPVLEVPKDVGGRFSVLTPVGMFPAKLMGLDPAKFWRGSEKALSNKKDVTEFIARALESFEQQKWITQFWLYGTNLRSFGEWLVQLWSESLGKKVGRNGLPARRCSTPVVALGAIDQHSMLQQTMEGVQDKWPVFIRSREHEHNGAVINSGLFKETALVQGRRLGDVLRVEAQATQDALTEQGIATHKIEFLKLDEENLGYWFFFFELVVAGLGEALDINAFDQPGVELGKRLAQDSLKNEKLSASGSSK